MSTQLNRSLEPRKVSRLSTLEHRLLSEFLRGVAPASLTPKALAARETLRAERLLRKTAQGFVATKNGATLLDADARCPLCSALRCKAHPVRFNMEAMRHTRGVMLQIRRPKRAA
jgi:hypothetical protein